ncbi:MAG: M20/M25/M40 family metallo-hydrolase [Phycisphaerales bacterium]
MFDRLVIRKITVTSLLAVVAGSVFAGDPQVAGTPKHDVVAVIDGKEVPPPAIEMGDPATIAAILDEGKNRNQVMDHLTHLTKKIGSRLTGSQRLIAANNWCREQYVRWGLSNPHLEQWGEVTTGFDRGPCTGKMLLAREKKNDDKSVSVEYDTLRDFEFSTLSWTKGTEGPVRGKVVREPQTDAEYEAVKDQLPGAWVLVKAASPIGQRGVRRRMADFAEMRTAARKKLADGAAPETLTMQEKVAVATVAGFISTTRDERVWTGAIGGWRERKIEDYPNDLSISVRSSDYDAINSRLADGEPIELEFNLQHTLTPGPVPVYNTIAEIPGTTWPDEIVIVSGHLDSWDGVGAEGCTDNGTGSATTLETARILMAVGAKPKRTIRFVDWSGEEQGLLGSAGYVVTHEAELPKISAVFVDDGGTNYDGALSVPKAMVDMLAAATAPINNVFYDEVDAKFLNCDIRTIGERMPPNGGSDHATFNNKGVPGFYWVETGRADYGHGWHTQYDKLDLAIPNYLAQSATCAAVTAYNLACAPTLVPRPPAEEKKDK